MLHELEDLAAEMASRGDEVTGDSRLGVIGTTARWLLPQLLGQVTRAHPRVHVTIHEGNTSSLLPRLQASQIDAAILHLPIDDPELQVEPLFAEDLLLLAHSRFGLARMRVRIAEGARQDPAAAAAARHRAAPHHRPGRGCRRRRAAGAGRDRRRATAGLAGVRGLRRGDRAGHRGAALAEGRLPAGAVPELPRRVVGWVQRRRPAPGIPTRVLLAVLRDVIALQGPKQPGVHVGAEAFPLGRAV